MNNQTRAKQMVKEIVEKGDVRQALSDRGGSRSNIFADRNRIYSYGRHYVIAIYMNEKWFVNSLGYSPSTGRHTLHVRRAIVDSGVGYDEILNVPLSNDSSDSKVIPGALTASLRELEQRQMCLERTRKGSGNNLRILGEIKQIKDNISRLVVLQEMNKEV